MSWKTSGKLLSGPPTNSNTNKLDPRFKPNLGGLNAFQREQALVGRYGGRESAPEVRRSEWDVLKENHRFIRDDEEPGEVSWEERLARAYESKLFKEFALIDLKHFKSRRLALRWRTAEEVVDGIGEETCASLRCKYHSPIIPSPRRNGAMWEDASTPGPSVSERGYDRREKHRKRPRVPALRAFELPFVYEEAGQRKEALVKVKLCSKCQGKLTWKPGKEEPESADEEAVEDVEELEREVRRKVGTDEREQGGRHRRRRSGHSDEASSGEEGRDRHTRRRTRSERDGGRAGAEQDDDDDDDDDRHHVDRRKERRHASDERESENGRERFRPRPLRRGVRDDDEFARSSRQAHRSPSRSRSRSPPPRRRNLM